MKRKLVITVLVLGLISAALGVIGIAAINQGGIGDLKIGVQPDKISYLPGELVRLDISITNTSNSVISFPNEATVWDGNVKVFIAYKDAPFKEYVGPAWGIRDTVAREPLKLSPGQAFQTDATILWNQKRDTSHLSPAYKQEMAAERLDRAYAFTEPGTYSIKVVLHKTFAARQVESDPVSITVEEPQGDDQEIWNKIKNDSDYALFIQSGGLMEHPTGLKTLKVVDDLQKLLSRHPNSRYANRIRKSLSKQKETIGPSEHDEFEN